MNFLVLLQFRPIKMENHCQVESGMNAIFAGVYDGHCGPEAAMFIKEHLFQHLFQHLINMTWEHRTFSSDVLRSAIKATENGFLVHVETTHETNSSLPITGSGCLVGVIWKGTLHIANVGDSCAVIGSVEEHKSDMVVAEKLTTEHNVRNKAIRTELKFLHPNDPDIVD